jgi:hypothetical protein
MGQPLPEATSNYSRAESSEAEVTGTAEVLEDTWVPQSGPAVPMLAGGFLARAAPILGSQA